MTTQATADQLPPLPEPAIRAFSPRYESFLRFDSFTADQMNAHASAYALASLTASQAEIVMLREAIDAAIAYLGPRLSHQPNSHGAVVVLPKLLKDITQGAKA